MFTHKDIQHRSIYVINCIHERTARVCSGELLLEETQECSDKPKILTKMPFQKILVLFIIGHIKITTPLIEKCRKYGVALIVVKPSLRPVFFWSYAAEANFILHKRQYDFDKDDISIARIIVKNKLLNQLTALNDTRRKDDLTKSAKDIISECLNSFDNISDFNTLLGVEGTGAKAFFRAFYQDFNWQQRRPRTKCDALNASLDIGYTILFNFIECYLRMFGFDIYVGVYHRLWFKRKSLVCDIMEPFRPIVDKIIRTAWNRKQFAEKDYKIIKGEWRLKFEKNGDYTKIFFDGIIPYKIEVFKYVQAYYRCFMGGKSVNQYPYFIL